MLTISEELSSFKPIDLDSLEHKVGKIPEDMKNAIELYNKALEDIGSKNEDMAIIALKKAISIYPAFYEAMNLMGVCYMSLQDEENARKMFNKVIQMDDSSIRAARYLDRLDGKLPTDEGKPKSGRAKSKPKGRPNFIGWVGSGLSPEKKAPYFLKYILGFVFGALTVSLLWLLFPENKPLFTFSRQVNESKQLADLKEENTILNGRLEEFRVALETAKQTERKLQDQMDQYMKWSSVLRDLQNMADAGKYKDVVIEIEKNLAGLELPEDIEKEIIALNNACKPKAVRQIYESARKTYDSNSKAKAPDVYRQSAAEFALAISIMEELQEKPGYMAELYYYGGKAIALAQQPTKDEAEAEAIRCFKAVISEAPGSKLASYAQSRINEIQSGKTIRH